MNVTIKQTDQPAERRRELWNWCYANGFIATEITDPIVVDTDRGIVTVYRLLTVSQPGDPDFPELLRDECNRPLTETLELPMVESLPDWLVIEADRIAA